jgi:hypothetical protein
MGGRPVTFCDATSSTHVIRAPGCGRLSAEAAAREIVPFRIRSADEIGRAAQAAATGEAILDAELAGRILVHLPTSAAAQPAAWRDTGKLPATADDRPRQRSWPGQGQRPRGPPTDPPGHRIYGPRRRDLGHA